MTLPINWRVPAALAVLALLAWVGFEIGRAGSDIQVSRIAAPGSLTGGRVEGKRLDGKSWSLDYDTVAMSPDNSVATIAHVRDGRLRRAGKPDVTMQADGVQVNTVTNDLIVTGHVRFVEPQGNGRTRTFETTGARYSGGLRQLELDHPATITDGATKITVSTVSVNFRTGEMTLGHIEGIKNGAGS